MKQYDAVQEGSSPYNLINNNSLHLPFLESVEHQQCYGIQMCNNLLNTIKIKTSLFNFLHFSRSQRVCYYPYNSNTCHQPALPMLHDRTFLALFYGTVAPMLFFIYNT